MKNRVKHRINKTAELGAQYKCSKTLESLSCKPVDYSNHAVFMSAGFSKRTGWDSGRIILLFPNIPEVDVRKARQLIIKHIT